MALLVKQGPRGAVRVSQIQSYRLLPGNFMHRQMALPPVDELVDGSSTYRSSRRQFGVPDTKELKWSA